MLQREVPGVVLLPKRLNVDVELVELLIPDPNPPPLLPLPPPLNPNVLLENCNNYTGYKHKHTNTNTR